MPARIAAWEDDDSVVVARAAATLEEICADDSADLARMSVGLRVVRGLLATGWQPLVGCEAVHGRASTGSLRGR